MIFAEIMLTLKALQGIASAISTISEDIKKLNLAIENKQIDDFKKDVNEKLDQIKNAQSDDDRKRLIVELSKRMQK